ncbi:hypothetical protein BDV59DRAFT_200646 [Aspergillus ambiguus]|uniref:uncharacterized protein n=1 Tax=Aspergillus ambiguus TaxID=176160 RepID=UPI003CCD706A
MWYLPSLLLIILTSSPRQQTHPQRPSRHSLSLLYDLLLPPSYTLIQHAHQPNPGRKWFDCAECHHEQESHTLAKATEMVFACKKCKKCFRKDATEFEESDEYCPHCDNHFVIDAVTPKPALQVEGEDARIDSRMLKDDRVRGDQHRSIFTASDPADRLG